MYGALIKEGVSEWQIFQQTEGYATIAVSGIWKVQKEQDIQPVVYLCVRREETGEPVVDWTQCKMQGREWKVSVKVPAGGLYQIETCLVEDGGAWFEWADRGDIVSHVGVGDLYVIAGQSNSAGFARDHVYDPCELGVHILKNDQKWHLAVHPLQDSTEGEEPVNMEPANPGHSLYLSFAKYLKRELHYPIGLIQTAKGGMPLSEWDPKTGKLYQNMLKRVYLAGGRVKGVVWYQGCFDAAEGLCETYYERFLEFYEAFCRDTKQPKLPWFVCQLNKFLAEDQMGEDAHWGMVREAQRRIGRCEHIYTIPTTDCKMSDLIHNSASANMMLGERLAKLVLYQLYGKAYMCEAPDIASATKTAADSIEIRFDKVYDKIDTFLCTPDMLAFTAEDKKGKAAVTRYEIIYPDSIRLHFERILTEGCVLHGAYEKVLHKIVPIDLGSRIPMLSFYAYPVLELMEEEEKRYHVFFK